MNRTQKAMRNSTINLLRQVITILLGFISRKAFIQYLGVELLGLNSTFASLLNTLSLAELGFHHAIGFHLYGVLAKGDKEQINSLVNIYKLVYRCIGCFFIGAALCCVPFLQYFLSDVEATNSVRVYFLIQALTGACTYFLAYKRNILYADQNSYISGFIDMIVNTTATLLSIAAAVLTGNYLLFLLIQLVKTYLSNLFVHVACTKRYPYLHTERIDWQLLRKIARNVKDVVMEQIATYIYGSTDNLLISMFISTIQVGFLNNYSMVIINVKNLMRSLSIPLIPTIGNVVAAGLDTKQQVEKFQLLEQGVFWLAGLAVVPVYVLTEFFITIYLGEAYILPGVILFFLCMDMYIHINQDPCVFFMAANGLFKVRRNISILGAIVNIVVSALLIRPFGMAGILAGTAMSQVFYWVSRSVVAIRHCLKQSWRVFSIYWLKQAAMLGVIVAAVWLGRNMTQHLYVVNSVLTFIVCGILCEACFAVLAFVCTRGIAAQRSLERTVGSILRQRLGKAK